MHTEPGGESNHSSQFMAMLANFATPEFRPIIAVMPLSKYGWGKRAKTMQIEVYSALKPCSCP